jgi:hypothetical protein
MRHVSESQYKPAAVCRRGHVATSDVELSPELASSRCRTCGDEILRDCPKCGRFIRGRYQVPGVIGGGQSYKPPDFCEDCGAPFPWLSRRGRIYLLQNVLDDSDIDEASKLRAREQLEALLNPDLDEDEERRLWERFKKAAPTVWAAERAQVVIDTVLEAGTRAMIDKYTP